MTTQIQLEQWIIEIATATPKEIVKKKEREKSQFHRFMQERLSTVKN